MAFTKITAAGIGSTETVTLDGLSVINNGSFGGNLTVGGVLTYEDVTNVDSVGLITARNGIVVGSGITLSKDGDIFATGITTISENLKVGTGVTISPDGDGFFTGVITATSYSGIDLGAVTGATGDFSIADKIVHTGDTDTAIRFSGADTIQFETGGSSRLQINSSGHTVAGGDLFADADLYMIDYLKHTGDTNTSIRFPAADTVTVETGGTERFRINSTGQTIVGDTVAQLSTNAERPFQVHSINGPKIAIGRNDTSISDGNTIGGIEFYGNDANGTFVNTASIIVDADGTHGDNDKPTRMLFYTTADGGSSATERLRIASSVHVLPAANNTYNLGSSSNRWANLYVNDAHFSNEGSTNSVDGTWGDWTLQEGENDIYMINNRSGKKYKFNLTEVS